MRALVTGGAGFIGSNLVDRLLADGADVRVLDNFSSGKRHNLAHCLGQIDLIEGDLSDLATVHSAMQDVDHVYHLGAFVSVPDSVNNPLAASATNVQGTLNILVAARDAQARRVVLSSSAAIYGDEDPAQAKVETLRPQPTSPYGADKLAAETYCQVFHHIYEIETVILRYFNVFGPRQDPTSQYAAVIPRFITSMLQGQSPTIFGDGQQTRDFIFVADIVAANRLVMSSPHAPGQIFNISRHKAQSINMLVDAINQVLGTDIEPIHADIRAGDILHSLADVSKAQEILGFESQTSFVDGLRATADWFRANGQTGT